jgi:D-glycero-alpha-D-manno-heptose-7-phosphate kinase
MPTSHAPSPHYIRASAPIRICDLGGWTDTWFAGHGRVVSIAVAPLAQVDIAVHPRSARESWIAVRADNLGRQFVYTDAWQHEPLLEAAITLAQPPETVALEIDIFCDAPAGASTGTSAAVTVALLAGLDLLTPGRKTAHELAWAAHRVETELLKRQCGIQDQLAAAYGGVLDIEMYAYPHAAVSAVPISNTTRHELDARLVTVFAGRPHDSSAVHEKVIRELEDAGPDNGKIIRLRQAALHGRNALTSGDLPGFAAAMCANTDAQAALNPALIGPDAQRIIDIARAHAAPGWKVNGAGGDGGSVTLLTGPSAAARRDLLGVLGSHGYQPIPTRMCVDGAQARVYRGE